MEEEKKRDELKSIDQLICHYSATLEEEYGGGLTSKRIVVYAVRKLGVEKIDRPEFYLKLCKPISLSEVYETLFKGKWTKIRNPMTVMERALRKDETEGYLEIDFSKKENIMYCSFTINPDKWAVFKRLDRYFFQLGLKIGTLRKDLGEEKIKEITEEERQQKIRELREVLGIPENKAL